MANDNRNNQRREHILAATLAVLLGAVLLTSHAVSGAMAKYTTAGSSSDEARVALFGHRESITFETFRTSLVNGASSSFNLIVSNKSQNGQISEVAQSYDIEIVTAGNLPLTYRLVKKAGVGKPTDTVIGSFNASATEKSHVFTVADGSMTFQPGASREDTYQIQVSWYGDDGAKWSNIPDFLQVNINVKQID